MSMTADRTKALALISEMGQKGKFNLNDAIEFAKRIKDLEKEFEFEATIEESNEVTPSTHLTQDIASEGSKTPSETNHPTPPEGIFPEPEKKDTPTTKKDVLDF